MQPEQATFLLNDFFLPQLRSEHAITKKVIGAIPADKCGFQPDGVAKSAIDLAWHIVAAEMRFFEAVPAGQFDFTPRHRPDSIHTAQDLLLWYAENFEPRLESLARSTADQLMKIVDFRGLFQLPAVMYLNFILHHTIHHRGQLSMYLRPMGAKVPSIYGESWDDAQARLAAKG
jgi:uncharacterized damage-inducible protein DinB